MIPTATRSRTARCGSPRAPLARSSTSISETRATVARVPDGDAALLRYLTEISIVPGQDILLIKSAPFGGPLTVRTGTGEHAIARELAAAVGIA